MSEACYQSKYAFLWFLVKPAISQNTFKLNDLKQEGSLTSIRIEGSKNSIDQRLENLVKELKTINFSISILGIHQSEIFLG